MLTVTQLAKRCGISRATLLYYERAQLIAPAYRADNGYRWYGDNELERLRHIVSYRAYGLPVASIHHLLDRAGKSQAQILREHFEQLEHEIQKLRAQQKAIVVLLQEPERLEETMVTKQRWVEIMQAAGFSENDMVKWHQTFEKMEPQEHQKFLQSLGITADEIEKIRAF